MHTECSKYNIFHVEAPITIVSYRRRRRRHRYTFYCIACHYYNRRLYNIMNAAAANYPDETQYTYGSPRAHNNNNTKYPDS